MANAQYIDSDFDWMQAAKPFNGICTGFGSDDVGSGVKVHCNNPAVSAVYVPGAPDAAGFFKVKFTSGAAVDFNAVVIRVPLYGSEDPNAAMIRRDMAAGGVLKAAVPPKPKAAPVAWMYQVAGEKHIPSLGFNGTI